MKRVLTHGKNHFTTQWMNTWIQYLRLLQCRQELFPWQSYSFNLDNLTGLTPTILRVQPRQSYSFNLDMFRNELYLNLPYLRIRHILELPGYQFVDWIKYTTPWCGGTHCFRLTSATHWWHFHKLHKVCQPLGSVRNIMHLTLKP